VQALTVIKARLACEPRTLILGGKGAGHISCTGAGDMNTFAMVLTFNSVQLKTASSGYRLVLLIIFMTSVGRATTLLAV